MSFHISIHHAMDQGRTQQGGQGVTPLEKTIFTIFRMKLLIILWVFGTLVYTVGLTVPLVKNPAYGPAMDPRIDLIVYQTFAIF